MKSQNNCFKDIYKIIAFLILSIVLFSCQNEAASSLRNVSNTRTIRTIKLHSKQDSIEYALGVVIGNEMKNFGIHQIDYGIVMKAIKDVLENNTIDLPINSLRAKQIVSLYVKSTKDRKVVEYIDKNSTFLHKNAQQKGVKTLSNGLQYKIIKSGKGKRPSLSDRVVVSYSGQLVDGTVFVSTFRARPVTFIVRNSLLGWQSALTKMSEGAQWIIYLTPSLAFGNRRIKNIPPNSVVIYKIKLIKIL